MPLLKTSTVSFFLIRLRQLQIKMLVDQEKTGRSETFREETVRIYLSRRDGMFVAAALLQQRLDPLLQTGEQ